MSTSKNSPGTESQPSLQTQKSPKKGGKRSAWGVTRCIFRVFLLTLAGVCLLSIVGILALRSSWAERRLTTEIPALLNPILAEQGLYLEIDQLSGPLPSRLRLNGLRLYDGFGLFLTAESIEARLALSELFRGALTIEVLQATRPTLSRLPESIPHAPHEDTQTEDTSLGVALDLPIDIRLNTLAIEGASLPWAILGLSPQGNLFPAEAPLEATTEPAQLTIKKPLADNASSIPAPAQSAQSAQSVLNDNRAFTAQKAWNKTLSSPLRVDIKGSAELSHGILHASLGMRARDSGTANTTESIRPLDKWLEQPIDKSAVDAAGQPVESSGGNVIQHSTNPADGKPTGSTNTSAGDLAAGPTDSSAKKRPAPQENALGDSVPNTQPDIVPDPLSEDTPHALPNSSTSAMAQKGAYGDNFDLTLTLNPVQLTLIEADHNIADISGHMAFTLGDITQHTTLEALAEITDTTATLTEFNLEGFGLSLTSSAEVALPTGQPTASLALTSAAMDDLLLVLGAITGESPKRLEGLMAPLALNLSLTHDSQSLLVHLDTLQAGGFHAKGKVALGNIFHYADKNDSSAVNEPNGQKTSASNDVSLSDASRPNTPLPDTPLSGTSLSEAPLADKPLTSVTTDLPLTAMAQTSTPRTEGSLEDSLEDSLADSLQPKTSAPIPALTIDTQLSFAVDTLETFSPEIGGSLKGNLTAQGSLAHLQGNLDITSPNLTTASGDLHAFTATLTVSAKEQENGAKNLQGSFKASAAPNTLGPTDIHLDWATLIPPADESGKFISPLTASINQLRVSVFGLAMEGNLKTSVAPQLLNPDTSVTENKTADGNTVTQKTVAHNTVTRANQTTATPETLELNWPQGLLLNGQLHASVTDWAPLSLFAQTPLTGKNTRLTIDLEHTGANQKMEVKAQSDSFSAPRQGFSIDTLDLTASALVPETQGKLPNLSLSLATGQGEVADISWTSIKGDIADAGGKGNIAFLIMEDQQKTLHKKGLAAHAARTTKTGAQEYPAQGSKDAHTQNKSTSTAPSPSFTTKLNRGELLSLQGHYDLQNMGITLEKLALKEPLSQTEIQLRDSTAIHLKEGLTVQGLTLDMSSGGSLTAEVTQKENTLQAKATLATLPLTFINDMAGTTLPPGHVNADVFLQTGSKAPQGAIDLQLLLANPTRGTREEPDVHLQANIIQSGGRFHLAGGLDFSRLAQSSLRNSSVPSQSGAPAVPLSTQASKQTVDQTSAQALGQTSRQTAGPRSPLAGISATGTSAPLTFKIPLLIAEGFPLPDMQGPFQANLRWHGPLDGFWQLVPLPDTEFSALASIDLGLSGTLAAPKTGGTAYIAQGHIYDKGLGLLLTDMTLEAHASHSEEYRIVLAAQDGNKGSIGLEGALQFKGIPSLNLRGQLKHLSPLHRDDVKITLTGLLGANGPLHAPKVTADILVERGEIELLAAMGNGSVRTLPITDPTAVIAESDGSEGELNVTVTIPKRFYIRGLGLDSEWQGKLHISGAFAEPQLVGSLNPVRGYFELISKPFAFTGGEIVFAGGSKINPGLSLELTHTTSELEAIIKAGGSLEKPKLDLQSNPPLPKDEVLAHVLFGKKISELSRFEALQLANSMSELAGISSGNLNPLTSMRKATGLDVLRFGSDDDNSSQRQDSGMTGASNLGESGKNGESATESAPTLEAGKYINDSIYIGVEQGVTQESTGVRVEIELFPNTTLQGKSTAKSSSAGIGWKMDY